jgi:hypothetical protein
MKRLSMVIVATLLAAAALADDEVTLYELLLPETHQFAITYDVSQTREGAEFFFNPIRACLASTRTEGPRSNRR